MDDKLFDNDPSRGDEKTDRTKLKKTGSKKKRLGAFKIFYISLVAVLVVGLISCIWIFYDFIREYELSLPEHIADSYIRSLDNSSFAALVGPVLEERASGFETSDALGEALAKAISENGITYTECIGEDVPAYDVYCGGKLMKVRLEGTSGGRYGFTRYKISSAEVYPDWIDSRFSTITVIIPEAASLTLNGKPVDEGYLTDVEYESATLSEFDSVKGGLVTYMIKGVFGDADLSAEFDGSPLTISRLGSDDTYYSDYDLPTRFDYEIKVPLDASVTVNGAEVPKSLITGSEKLTGLKNEFEPDTAPELAIYSLKGLIYAPEVTASLDGSPLAPEASDASHIEYTYPDAYRQSFTVRVPTGMKLYCNGIEVGDRYAVGEGTYEAPSSAKVKATAKYVEYKVGLFNEPNFTVSAADAVMTNEEGVTVFYPVPSSAEKASFTKISDEFTRLFVIYATESGRKAQEHYDAFIDRVLPNSDAYKIIHSTLSAMIYNSAFVVQSLEVNSYDLIKYSDDCFFVKADFVVVSKYLRWERTASETYEMVWVKKSGEWKLAGFKM